jgi:hypothetical protein
MTFNFFKKKGESNGGVVDLADLQRRGILKKDPVDAQKSDDGKVVDFTAAPKPVETPSILGFLGTMASSSEQNNESTNKAVSPLSPYIQPEKPKPLLFGDLKSTLKHNSDNIYKMMQRIDLLEKKIDRLERRTGVVN